MGPIAHSDGHDAPGLIDKLFPGVAAVIDDVLGGFEDAIGEPVVAQELPGVLGRIQLGRLGRQEQDGDIGGQIELVGGVPARLIHQDNGVGVGRDCLGKLRELQVHRRGVAEGQYQSRCLAFGWTDRAEDIDRLSALIVRSDWPRAAQGPTPGDFILLADPCFIGEPDLYALARRLAGRDLCQAVGEVLWYGPPLLRQRYAGWVTKGEELFHADYDSWD